MPKKNKVDPEDATTGVHSIHDVEWMDDFDQGIDLTYEKLEDDALKFLKTRDGIALLQMAGFDEGDEPDFQSDEDFWEKANKEFGVDYPTDEMERGSTLAGAWKKDKETGLWNCDKSGKRGDYCAIENPDSGTIQVVWSKWKILSAPASLCYPDQADVDTPPEKYRDGHSKGIYGYILPPSMLHDDWVKENRDRIVGDLDDE